MREFLWMIWHRLCICIRKQPPDYLYNVGTGEDLTIKQLAETIQKITGHQGRNHLGCNKTRWYPRKLMDISKMHALGWKHQVQLEEGIQNIRLVLENIEFKQVKM
jgi:GDP-L-fucose synthase